MKFLGRGMRKAEKGYEWESDDSEEWEQHNFEDQRTGRITEEASKYCRAAARLDYLAHDRSDIVVALCVYSRTVSRPRERGEVRLKRVLRYLRVHPNCVLRFPSQGPPRGVIAYTDSDWMGDWISRESTVMVLGGIHEDRFASRLQKVVALSSGEAELNAHAFGLRDGLGSVTLCEERGMLGRVETSCDSSAARGLTSRVGHGKLKHLQVKRLRAQELVRCGLATLSRDSQLLTSVGALVQIPPCANTSCWSKWRCGRGFEAQAAVGCSACQHRVRPRRSMMRVAFRGRTQANAII